MKRRLFALLLALMMLAFCGCSGDVEYNPPEKETEQTAYEYPGTDLTVYDAEGNAVKLSDMVGKPVVLNFWATWCAPCKSELPAFQQAYEAYGDQVQFMMVDLVEGRTETAEGAISYVEENGFTFPLFFDNDQKVLETYKLSAVPASYFIDAQGNLISQHIGTMSYEMLEGNIQEII